ncbi:MAG: hypothetical protein KBA17_01440 [Aliarcobacter sp.]|nr:hypothetical protein [Aliarcobacter sp.]MBP9616193.1 hypothetical protein [Aliarcobacter sp.]
MTYDQWFQLQGELHSNVMKKLTHKSVDEIIEYFKFENMVKNEPDFCPLYKDNKKCHDVEELNCYLCACPHFRFDDLGFEKIGEKVVYSFCSIDSKKGAKFEGDDYIHHDCSGCTIPHRAKYIKANDFKANWFEAMKDVRPNKS